MPGPNFLIPGYTISEHRFVYALVHLLTNFSIATDARATPTGRFLPTCLLNALCTQMLCKEFLGNFHYPTAQIMYIGCAKDYYRAYSREFNLEIRDN